ncbi:MAG: GDSL-type esterase/lipase family protein [Propionibacteriaceae bacterium]|nr:GDSL-type esterase/lipase family protein [Propionibacteriaceae bacterium]
MRKTLLLLLSAALLVSIAGFTRAGAQTTPRQRVSIALIGDSYTAGNGAGQYDKVKGAYRSARNWGNVYARWLNDQGAHANLVNLAHSGYTTDQILAIQVPQVSTASDLVLFTAGGNDVKFEQIVTRCFGVGYRDPVLCRDHVEDARANLDKVRSGTLAVLRALEARLSPGAQVVFVGYPLLALHHPGYRLSKCVQRNRFGVCTETFRYEAATEVRKLGVEANRLQATMVEGWNRTSSLKVTFVDAQGKFDGHEPYSSAALDNRYRWINELLETEGQVRNRATGVVSSRVSADKNNFYHPNIEGHLQLGWLLGSKIGIPQSAKPILPSSGSAIDLAFVIDTTGSMGGSIASVQQEVRNIVAAVEASSVSARYSLATYRDHPESTGDPGDYASKLRVPFTTDSEQLITELNALTVDGGGDWEETVYSGAMAGLNQPWRDGVKKVMLILGDAPAKDPEPITGYTAESVARVAFEIDPVEVYAIDTGDLLQNGVDRLVELSGGTAHEVHSGEAGERILEAIETIADKPFGWVQGPTVLTVGEEFTFDARGSYAMEGEIVQYEWDFNGDGEFDLTETTGEVTRSFSAPFDGFMGVRVTDERGQQSMGSTALTVVAGCSEGELVGDECVTFDPYPTEDLPDVFEEVVEDEPAPEPPTDPAPEPEPTTSPSPEPTRDSSPGPEQGLPGFTPAAPYTLSGTHNVNGRLWRTGCEKYSATVRCRTEIEATVVKRGATGYHLAKEFTFNNLTYLPSKRDLWTGNPLAQAGEWKAKDGRRWRTECGTPKTGRDGCRSYVIASVVEATARPGGGYTYRVVDKWVFNNIVMFSR